MNQQDQQGTKGSFWMGLLIGGAISLAMVVLLGSERGKKILQQIQDEGFDSLFTDAKDEVTQKVDEIKEKSQDFVNQGKEVQQEVVDTVNEAKADATEILAEKVDETLSHIEAIQERGRQSTAELRRRLFKNIPKKA